MRACFGFRASDFGFLPPGSCLRRNGSRPGKPPPCRREWMIDNFPAAQPAKDTDSPFSPSTARTRKFFLDGRDRVCYLHNNHMLVRTKVRNAGPWPEKRISHSLSFGGDSPPGVLSEGIFCAWRRVDTIRGLEAAEARDEKRTQFRLFWARSKGRAKKTMPICVAGRTALGISDCRWAIPGRRWAECQTNPIWPARPRGGGLRCVAAVPRGRVWSIPGRRCGLDRLRGSPYTV